MSIEQAPTTAGSAFFSPAANIKPYLKVAAQGFAGTGKTFTLMKIAIALVLQRKKLDPKTPMRIAMIDTEKSSGFLRRIVETAGIELVVKETRALVDVMTAMDLCESGYAPVLLLDSMSHIYENFVQAYKNEAHRNRLEMFDWGVLKPRWKDTFSARFVRSRIDILFTGRAGYEYDTNETVTDSGKKKLEIYKSGVKMKIDGETAYEPDIVLHMDRIEELLEDDKVVYRTCTILKDRSGLLDGKTLKNPTGVEFAPVFDYLLANPAAVVADEPEGNDRSLFQDDDATEKKKLRREILLETVEETIKKAAPGQTTEEKKFRQSLLENCFGTLSWRAVTVMDLDKLDAGLRLVREIVEAARSKKKTADIEGRTADLDPDPTPAAPAAKPAKAKESPAEPSAATDGAEVEVVKPMDMLTRERLRRSIRNGMHERNESPSQFLSDETGREVRETSDLTDDELTRIAERLTRPVTT
jgi:hypothetical protein